MYLNTEAQVGVDVDKLWKSSKVQFYRRKHVTGTMLEKLEHHPKFGLFCLISTCG